MQGALPVVCQGAGVGALSGALRESVCGLAARVAVSGGGGGGCRPPQAPFR